MNNYHEPFSGNWQERGELLENLEISLRYYRRREWFFDKCEKLCNGLTVISGAAVVSQYIANYAAPLGVAIAIFGMMPLIFGFGKQQFLYKNLATKACELIGTIETHSTESQVTDDWLSEIKIAYSQISAQEPPTLAILALMCEQDYFVSRGIFDKVKPIPWWVRMFAQLGDLQPAQTYVTETKP